MRMAIPHYRQHHRQNIFKHIVFSWFNSRMFQNSQLFNPTTFQSFFWSIYDGKFAHTEYRQALESARLEFVSWITQLLGRNDFYMKLNGIILSRVKPRWSLKWKRYHIAESF
jgi:hypothetical protein